MEENLQKYLNERHPEKKPQDDNHLRLRNWLNIIFMIGAIVGVIVYFTVGHTAGIIIMLVAVVFKMVESALRFVF